MKKKNCGHVLNFLFLQYFYFFLSIAEKNAKNKAQLHYRRPMELLGYSSGISKKNSLIRERSRKNIIDRL
jgi:hypothetical protein